MTTALNGDLCRITVEGPDKRVDLAVPAATPVAALLPVLLWHTAEQAGTDLSRPEESWVLQRLGGEPFDPAGTPESLDWLEGERLYLRPVENQLPDLHFDDISEGIAETVNERGDKWQPEYRRPLFVGVSAVVIVLFTAVLLNRGSTPVRLSLGAVLGLLCLVASVLFARHLRDRAMTVLFGLAAAALAGITTLDAADGAAERVVVGLNSLAAGSAAAAGVALVLVVTHRLWARAVPYPVFLVVLVLAGFVNALLWLRSVAGLDAPAAAGAAAAVLLGLLLFAPNLVLRAGRLRGPQLPKTGSELQFDIEPYPAAEMEQRANEAQNYLSVLVVCVSAALPWLFHAVLNGGGWASWALVGVLSAAVLLRARVLLNVWQRVALTACGSLGVIMLLFRATAHATTGWFVVVLLTLLALLIVTVLAALRPWPRRLLPIWEFIATVLDVIAGLAVLPLALQLMGAYSWARGLFG